MWWRQFFFIGWDLLYCSFSIYLRYHPDGLGGSVNHCTVNLSILHPYSINSSFTAQFPNSEPLSSNEAVSQPLCSIVTDNVNTSCLWEVKRQLNKWTKRSRKAFQMQPYGLHLTLCRFWAENILVIFLMFSFLSSCLSHWLYIFCTTQIHYMYCSSFNIWLSLVKSVSFVG